MPRTHWFPVVISLSALYGLPFTEPCRAAPPNYVLDEETVPESVKDVQSPMSYGFLKELRPRFVFRRIEEAVKKKLEPLPPFFRDTSLSMRVRNYYFDRDNSPNDDRVAWAMGGWLDYRSGWAFDRFRLGVNWYTSQRLYGPEDKGGTLLLKPVQTGFGVLGQAFAEIKLFEGMTFRGYRQTFDYPYLNRRDSRMVPVTFEAYAVKHETGSNLDWIAGHVTKIKTRASDQFVSMSEAAGFDDTDDGLSMAGMRYNFNQVPPA